MPLNWKPRRPGMRAAAESAHEAAGTSFTRKLPPGRFLREDSTVTRRLSERLTEPQIEEIERRSRETPELQPFVPEFQNPAARPWLLLTFGLWLGVDGVAESTGLSAAAPPDDVHAMARGPLAAAGGVYEADLVIDALRSAGVEPEQVRTGLDFGCSSARVVRVLAAAYPDVHWSGCDPNAPAIAWASEHLPHIDFFTSGNEPPLRLGDGMLDVVYAISIWSHFEPALGLRWFEEMYRVLAPGGHLVMTTHGPTAIAYFAERAMRPAPQLHQIQQALYDRAAWYAAEFGPEGDWGVVNPSWGTAFLGPEWVLANLCPRWRVLEYAPGRNQNNQDVYVLQRV